MNISNFEKVFLSSHLFITHKMIQRENVRVSELEGQWVGQLLIKGGAKKRLAKESWRLMASWCYHISHFIVDYLKHLWKQCLQAESALRIWRPKAIKRKLRSSSRKIQKIKIKNENWWRRFKMLTSL